MFQPGAQSKHGLDQLSLASNDRCRARKPWAAEDFERWCAGTVLQREQGRLTRSRSTLKNQERAPPQATAHRSSQALRFVFVRG
jgi:prophage antirepressor-like protein